MTALGSLDLGYSWPGALTLGRSAGPGIPDNELAIAITIPAPVSTMSFFVGIRYLHTASLPWHNGNPQQFGLLIAEKDTLPIATAKTIRWGSRRAQTALNAVRWGDGLPLIARPTVSWASNAVLNTARSIVWSNASPADRVRSIRWSATGQVSTARSVRWSDGIAAIRTDSVRWSDAIPGLTEVALAWRNGNPLRDDPRVRWSDGIPPPHGWRPALYDRDKTRKSILGELALVCKLPGTLTLGRACFGSGRLLIPIRRSYRVLNSAALIRVSDGADIHATGLSIATDLGSWCWQISVNDWIGPTAHSRIPEFPGLLQATVNGFQWQFVVDDVQRVRKFGDYRGQLTGRSAIAALSAPFASQKTYRESNLRTAVQLALQELPPGYTLDWQLPDWTVPGGVFQYENLTPIQIIARIAQAAGGRIYSDPSDKIIHAVPKWTRLPWRWNDAAADVTLPSSYTLRETLSNQDGAEYEAVMVSGGVNQGIVIMATREGMAGTTYAPSAVDALIVHPDPGRGKAGQVLADAWPMRNYTLDLPLQAPPGGAGLILPGTTLDFADGPVDGWRGLVVSTQISASIAPDGALAVNQQLRLVSP